MKQSATEISKQVALIASDFQRRRTGHAPQSVTVVLSEDTLVITLLEALTPAEKALSQTPQGAAQVQDFHRQLFASSVEEMRQEITRITGRQVREAATEVETATGIVVHAFTTGAMVQVFLLTPNTSSDQPPDNVEEIQIERADDDGLHLGPEADAQK
ncbi:DUF2294 domain-containing protein [Anatilimnocola floriformis]|uniref:DUF2294 domain-containing protein n=1 Tax=Anatilimnocola floriformis TaxID=2948575 RepID=UPI0020C43975|nr:Na-translocating system protein MpsC family protein [Anatilimnocola floriformis]